MVTAAILLAAGSGRRMGLEAEDKILLPIAGLPVIAHTLRAFEESRCIQRILIVHRDHSQRDRLASAISDKTGSIQIEWIQGGAERRNSVLAALRALPENVDFVFIHDAARPLIRPETLRELASIMTRERAVCTVRRVTDTIKEAPHGEDLFSRPIALRTLDRSRLLAMETPQVFERALITRAYEHVEANGLSITDDAAACEAIGEPVAIHECGYPNPKLTTPDDIDFIRFLIMRRG